MLSNQFQKTDAKTSVCCEFVNADTAVRQALAIALQCGVTTQIPDNSYEVGDLAASGY